MSQGDTLLNGTVGAVVSTILYLVPVVQTVAPIGGGLVAGYLQKGGIGGGIKAGGAKGFIMVLPAIGISMVAANMLADIPIIGGMLTGSLAILVIVIVIHSLFLGMVGGLVGGAVAGSPDPTRSSNRERNRGSPNDGVSADSKSDPAETTPEQTCPGCGEPLAENAQFCETCGAKVADSSDETATNSAGEPAEERESTCPSCGTPVNAAMKFCQECGASLDGSSHEEAPNRANTTDSTANNKSTMDGLADDPDDTRENNEPQSNSVKEAESEQVSSSPKHPARTIASSLLENRQLESETARRLLEQLSNPSTDDAEVTSAVKSAVETIEAAGVVKETLDDSKFETERQVKSAKREFSRANGDLAAAITPLLDTVERALNDVSTLETQNRTLESSLTPIVEAADREDTVTFRSNDVEERAKTLASALQSEDVVITEPGTSLGAFIDNVKRESTPQSKHSREMLEALENPDTTDAVTTIKTTVDRLDEYEEVMAMVSDIEPRDVRQRIDSIDEDLRDRDGPVYDHLADRVRELESMIDGRNTPHAVQLYAIYQECTFYDRTLLPRLNRARSSQSTKAVSDLKTEVEDRIQHVRNEYVSVRADHNHSIPKHFLALSEDLLSEADRRAGSDPKRAAGTLIAVEELVDHIEELYVRNEYSVMLRRLRG